MSTLHPAAVGLATEQLKAQNPKRNRKTHTRWLAMDTVRAQRGNNTLGERQVYGPAIGDLGHSVAQWLIQRLHQTCLSEARITPHHHSCLSGHHLPLLLLEINETC